MNINRAFFSQIPWAWFQREFIHLTFIFCFIKVYFIFLSPLLFNINETLFSQLLWTRFNRNLFIIHFCYHHLKKVTLHFFLTFCDLDFNDKWFIQFSIWLFYKLQLAYDCKLHFNMIANYNMITNYVINIAILAYDCFTILVCHLPLPGKTSLFWVLCNNTRFKWFNLIFDCLRSVWSIPAICSLGPGLSNVSLSRDALQLVTNNEGYNY